MQVNYDFQNQKMLSDGTMIQTPGFMSTIPVMYDFEITFPDVYKIPSSG